MEHKYSWETAHDLAAAKWPTLTIERATVLAHLKRTAKNPHPDAVLVGACILGCQEAHLLIRDMLWGLCQTLRRNSGVSLQDCHDICQQAFLVLYENDWQELRRPDFHENLNLRACLSRVVACQSLKTRQAKSISETECPDIPDVITTITKVSSAEDTLLRKENRKKLKRLFRAAAKKLSRRDFKIMKYRSQGLTQADIAQQMRLTPPYVSRTLSRIRAISLEIFETNPDFQTDSKDTLLRLYVVGNPSSTAAL